MKNVLEYLENSTLRQKDRIAVIEEDKKITYYELLMNSKRVGSGLTKHITSNKPIPVFMEKGINVLCAFFGVVYAGCPYVLLNPELPHARLIEITNIIENEVLITDNEHYKEAIETFKNKRILLIENLINQEIDEDILENARNKMLDTDPVYINFTSGSTGVPKGVVVCHQTIISFIDIFTKQFGIKDNDIIGNQAPFDFDVSVKDIYSSIKTGATLVIIPKRMFSKPAELLDYICDNNITTMIWAVSALCLITTFHGLEYKVPEKVNKVLFSGEVMPLKHIKQWIDKLPNAEFVNLYGPTEITCNCTYHIVDKELKYEKQIPIGKHFENEEVFLLDEKNNNITEINKTGEICVKGSTLALGYYNNPEQTKESFIQNPLNNKYIDLIYKTGDLGYLDENGDLNFAGRKDFQIKHLGHRIELEEIERAMESVKEVERACCIYSEEKSKIYAFFIGNIEPKELKTILREQIPIFMIPNVLNCVDEFKLNKNGKIDRKLLMENFLNKKK